MVNGFLRNAWEAVIKSRKPVADGYENNSNLQAISWDNCMASASQTTKSVDNIDLPSHAWVGVAVIVHHIWPRIVRSYFHVGSLPLWNKRCLSQHLRESLVRFLILSSHRSCRLLRNFWNDVTSLSSRLSRCMVCRHKQSLPAKFQQLTVSFYQDN